MAKPLTQEQKDDFKAFCETTLDESDGYFCLCHYDPFEEETESGDPLWEFHARNHNPDSTHDFYELFASMEEYEVEQHGHDEFWVVFKESEES